MFIRRTIGAVTLALAIASAPALTTTAEAASGSHSQVSKIHKTQYISEGGCGFMQRCVYFNRNEQIYMMTFGAAVMVAAICAPTVGIGCVLGGAIASTGLTYLQNHGLCTNSRRLRVQYFPWIVAEGCVA